MTIARLTAAATLTTALAAGGVAYAAGGTGFQDPQTPETPTTTSTTTSSPSSPAPDEEKTYAVAGSGSVTIIERQGVLQVTAVAAETGWTVEVERYLGREVEVVFSTAATRVHFQAELEDGFVTTSARTETVPGTVATATLGIDDTPDGSDGQPSARHHSGDEGSDDHERGRDDHLPDHVDLSSRPVSTRASDEAFAHAGGGVNLPTDPITVPGIGTLTFGVDDAGLPLVTVNAPGWNHEIDAHSHGEIDIELTRNDDEVTVGVGADGGIRIDQDID